MAGLFGSVPNAPAWNPVSLTAAQQSANAGNQAALPGAEQTIGQANQFGQSQLTGALNEQIPGLQGILQAGSGDIQSELNGQLPADVIGQIQAQDASTAAGGGFGGSGLAHNATARDLGLTSLQLTNQGIQNAQSWTANARQNLVAPQASVTSAFISPEQQYQAQEQQAANQWQQAWLQSQLGAAPDPHSVGGVNLGSQVIGTIAGAMI
jgi:hypothetical protein